MKEIIFTASFGHERKKVVLSTTGICGIWHLYVNNYWWGQFSTRQGEWVAHLHRPQGWITKADMDILCDLIAEAEDWPDQRA